MRKDATQMEASVRNRLALMQKQKVSIISLSTALHSFYLFKELMSFELASLSRSLKDSVSLADHEALRKEYQNMAEKYRQLMEADRVNMERAALDAKTEVFNNLLFLFR